MILPFQSLACPLDGDALRQVGKTWQCASGHCFDLASQGYLNLLPVQHKRSRDPGDSKEMVAARRRFLNAGGYAPIADAVARVVLADSSVGGSLSCLDAGCGEGYYLRRLAASAGDERPLTLLGLDISKWAVQAAARQSPSPAWVVGSNARLPVLDATLDCILCLFGFPVYAEFARVLGPGGLLLQVDAGPDHLRELREVLYPTLKPPREQDRSVPTGFVDAGSESVRFMLEIEGAERIGDLLAMTPHIHRATPEGRARALSLDRITVTVEVVLSMLRRAGGCRDGDPRNRLRHYARPVTELCPATRLSEVLVALPAPYQACNPSFVRDGDGYLGVVRGVNYLIEDGRYRIQDVQSIVRTRNFLVRLDRQLAVISMLEMHDHSGLVRREHARIQGYEDCRLFRWRGEWWCSATARDVVPDGRAIMVLLCVDNSANIVAAHPLRGFADQQHQKNWMPVVGERLRFIYSLGPVLVLDASAADGSFIVETGFDPGAALDHWRGGSQLMPWQGGWLCVTHEVCSLQGRRQYLHRFVHLGEDFQPLAASDGFCFVAPGIEFACGITDDGEGGVLLSFGREDRSAWVAVLAEQEIRSILRPLAGR